MTTLGFYPFDCLDYRLAANLVESIGAIPPLLVKTNQIKWHKN